MPFSLSTGRLFGIGVPSMIVALVLQNISLASGDYRVVLAVALILTAVAGSCFVAAFIRGGLAVRCASALLMLPILFVVSDFLRRAPHVYL